MIINVQDCIKDKITGCYLTQDKKQETRSRRTKAKIEEQKAKHEMKPKETIKEKQKMI